MKMLNRFICYQPWFPFVYILFGTVVYSYLSGEDLTNAAYFIIVSISTVGYGDIVPQTHSTMIFVCIYIFIGFLLFYEALHTASTDKSTGSEFHWRRLQNAVISMVVLISIGSTIFYLNFGGGDKFIGEFDNPTAIQSVYWAVITLTTVGYGDFTIESHVGRIFVSIFIILGVSSFVDALASISKVTVEMGRETQVKNLLKVGMSRELLLQMDANGDHEVDKCEFMTTMLIQLKKITHNDVIYINDLFAKLDTKKRGYLTKDDILHRGASSFGNFKSRMSQGSDVSK